MTEAGSITSHAGRKRGGKKIDTWEFFHPDAEVVKVDVHMHSGALGLTFSATAQNGPVAGKVWEGADIEALRQDAQKGLTAAARASSSTSWRPSLFIQLRPEGRRRNQLTTGFRIEVERLEASISVLSSNTGETEVIRGNRLDKVIQRSIGESRPDDTICGMHAESQHSAALIAARPDTEDDLARLCQTLDRFAHLLGERLGPDRIDAGIPSDDELVRLMQEAIRARR